MLPYFFVLFIFIVNTREPTRGHLIADSLRFVRNWDVFEPHHKYSIVLKKSKGHKPYISFQRDGRRFLVVEIGANGKPSQSIRYPSHSALLVGTKRHRPTASEAVAIVATDLEFEGWLTGSPVRIWVKRIDDVGHWEACFCKAPFKRRDTYKSEVDLRLDGTRRTK